MALSLSQGTYAIPSSSHGEISEQKKGGLGGLGGGSSSGAGSSGVPGDDGSATSPTGLDDDEESMDWWTKYFASVDAMIEVRIVNASFVLT